MAAVLVLVVKFFYGPFFWPCTRILRPILVLLFFVSVYSAMLGPQWYMFASFYVLVEFLVFPREKVDYRP